MSIADLAAPDLSPPRQKMTIEEFIALPDDGVDRMLIDGELWELGMTLRAHVHGEVANNIGTCLRNWTKTLPRPRGKVSCGDVGFRLPAGDNSMVGPDVAYAPADLVARTPRSTAFYDGPPILAVEVLSLSDTQDTIITKIEKYVEAGVVVWEVDPIYETLRVHRPGQRIELYSVTQELDADAYLPGFRVAVAEFFAD